MSSFDRYRRAGAMARVMLVIAAAEAVERACRRDHGRQGRRQPQQRQDSDLRRAADAAAKETPPADVTLKDAGAWTLIGNADLRRLDSPAKTTGPSDLHARCEAARHALRGGAAPAAVRRHGEVLRRHLPPSR
jgi:isoquinoline 1-oxidoreductase beta subunit